MYYGILALLFFIAVNSLRCYKKNETSKATGKTIFCDDDQGCEIYHYPSLTKRLGIEPDDFKKGCETSKLAIPFNYCMSYNNTKTKVMVSNISGTKCKDSMQ